MAKKMKRKENSMAKKRTASQAKKAQQAPGVLMKRIVDIIPATQKMRDAIGWDEEFAVIVLEDGTQLFASADAEFNGPGELNFVDPAGRTYTIFPPRGL